MMFVNLSITGAWEACCTSRSVSVPVADRLALWSGICTVLATKSEDHRLAAFESLASYSLNSLEDSLVEARNTGDTVLLAPRLSRVADDISVIASLPRMLVNANSGPTGSDMMESGCDTSPDTHPIIPESVISVVRRGWPSMLHAADNFSQDEVSP